MIILKFGGTSVSTKESLETICRIVQREQEQQPVVVVSAVSGVTDLLLSLPIASEVEQKITLQKIRDLHRDLLASSHKTTQQEVLVFVNHCLDAINQLLAEKKQTNAFTDKIASYGEIMSSYLVACMLNESNLQAEQVIATRLIVTDGHFGSAEFLPEKTRKKVQQILSPIITNGIVPVITGFIGASEKDEITTFDRGGSDYSAAIIGYALNATEIQIWTDVDGVFTADPRLIHDAKVLPHISYREAAELAAFGAKVLHPRTIRPAIQKNIPVRVLNTLNPEAVGTVIEKEPKHKKHIAAIAAKNKFPLVTVYTTEMLFKKGFLANVFAVFAKNNISVSLVSVSEVSVSISLDNDDNLSKVLEELRTFAQTDITHDFGVVSLIGEGIGSVPQILHVIFSTLEKEGIITKMISQSTADINISLVLPTAQINTAIAALHEKLVVQKGTL